MGAHVLSLRAAGPRSQSIHQANLLAHGLPKGLTGGYFASINDAGVAVGAATRIGTNETRGIIYQNGVVTILGEQIIAANEINNSGQIAGTAVIDGQQKAVLILP